MNDVCRVCGAEAGFRMHRVREMNFGSRETFAYLECDRCGSLCIEEIPDDLSRHYPHDYLGGGVPAPSTSLKAKAKAFVRRERTHFLMTGASPVGSLSFKRNGDELAPHLRALGRLRPGKDARILDVGCGPGRLLNRLAEQGYKNLTGQDRFQQWTLPGFAFHRRELRDVAGPFDIIMLHHSFEHMADPMAALADLRALLAPDGWLLLRIPVAGSEAWDRFGVDWYQIDAPRHLTLPSLAGMRALADRAGFDCPTVHFDSDETQFLCSAQYQRDIPLRDSASYYNAPGQTQFSAAEVAIARRDASRANDALVGDQACFYWKTALPHTRTPKASANT